MNCPHLRIANNVEILCAYFVSHYLHLTTVKFRHLPAIVECSVDMMIHRWRQRAEFDRDLYIIISKSLEFDHGFGLTETSLTARREIFKYSKLILLRHCQNVRLNGDPMLQKV